jgi:hypothetical protein
MINRMDRKEQSTAEILDTPWGRAAAYINDSTRASGLDQDVRLARFLGTKRKARVQHLVVHPEFPWFMDCNRMRGTYAERIRGVMENEDAIVLTYPGAKDHYPDFPYDDEEAVQTASQHDSITGVMDDHGLRSLLERLDGLHPQDEYVFHGSAFGMCVRAATRQVFALAEWGTYVPPSLTDTQRDHTAAIAEVISRLKLLQGRFHLGIVHNTRDQRWGTVEFDMLGKGTKVF